MHSTILTLAALAVSVAADMGRGIIINACDYEVDLCNVPSADGVHQETSTVLAANGGNFSHEWTALANSQGWSMKMNPSSDPGSVMQFEYTYASSAPNDLWFDLSYVDGQPFDNDWLISSNSAACSVKQTAYNNPTDDSNGMQPCCKPSVSITVTLCPANVKSISKPVSSSAVIVSATPVSYSSSSTQTSTHTTAVVSPTAYVKSSTTLATSTTKSPSSTTFATKTTSMSTSLATDNGGEIVTEVETVVATDIVTVFGDGGHHWQRHENSRRHAHNHN